MASGPKIAGTSTATLTASPTAAPVPVIRTVYKGDLSVLNSTQQTLFKEQVKRHIANRSGVKMADISVKLASGSIVATATLKNTVAAATVQRAIVSMNRDRPTIQIDQHTFAATTTTYHEVTVAPTKSEQTSLPVLAVMSDASDTYDKQAKEISGSESGSGIVVVMVATAFVAVVGMIAVKLVKKGNTDHIEHDKFEHERNDLLPARGIQGTVTSSDDVDLDQSRKSVGVGSEGKSVDLGPALA